MYDIVSTNLVSRDLTWVVFQWKLHFILLPCELHIMRICVRSNRLLRLSLFGPCFSSRMGISLLSAGVVYTCGRRCASWLLGRLVLTDRRVGCCFVRTTVHSLFFVVLCFESVAIFLCWIERLCCRGEFRLSKYILVLFCMVEVCFQAIVPSFYQWSSTYVWMRSNYFLLAWMCVLHVSRRSRWRPRYLTASCWGMGLPFR
jgi:hypothetical protein